MGRLGDESVPPPPPPCTATPGSRANQVFSPKDGRGACGPASACPAGGWAAFPAELLAAIFGQLDQPSLISAGQACRGWLEASLLPFPRAMAFSTPRLAYKDGRLFERLRSLSLFLRRRAASIHSLSLSIRVPRFVHLLAMRLAREAVRAASQSQLTHLALSANFSFSLAELGTALSTLRSLHLDSAEGSLCLSGDMSSWAQLTRLHVGALRVVSFANNARLPPSIIELELACIYDDLPPQLSQLSASLQRLVVRRAELSKGVIGVEYEVLTSLKNLRVLRLEEQADAGPTGWLPPVALAAITGLEELSIHSSQCGRWELMEEVFPQFSLALTCMRLRHLDLSDCHLEDLPPALSQLPALRVLLLHGNPTLWLTSERTQGWLPRLEVLSLDWPVLEGGPPYFLLHGLGLRRLALMGVRGLPEVVPTLRGLPQLQAVVLEGDVGWWGGGQAGTPPAGGARAILHRRQQPALEGLNVVYLVEGWTRENFQCQLLCQLQLVS